jgi:secondary thiamine-phosphate synthase enzyme
MGKPPGVGYTVVMAVHTQEFDVETRGNTEVIDLTPRVGKLVSETPITSGIVTVFVVGSTAGITTTEFEPGLVNHDLKTAFEKIAPEDGRYHHEETWHDDNGHSHVRASLIGPSLSLPLIDGRMALGTWQQIVLIDFDTRPRTRRIVVSIIGELSSLERRRGG